MEVVARPRRDCLPLRTAGTGVRPGPLDVNAGEVEGSKARPEEACEQAMESDAPRQGARAEVASEGDAPDEAASQASCALGDWPGTEDGFDSEDIDSDAAWCRASTGSTRGSNGSKCCDAAEARGRACAQAAVYGQQHAAGDVQPCDFAMRRAAPRIDLDKAPEAKELPETNAAITTVMVQNLPASFTRCDLVQALDYHGFLGLYDFVCVPVRPRSRGCKGYGFVNFVSVGAAGALIGACTAGARDSLRMARRP